MRTEKEHASLHAVLRTHGFRATKARTQLLQLLQRTGKPLSVRQIQSHWNNAPNQASVYRMLNDLAEARVIRRVDLHTSAAHFEYTPNRPHHHHIVCTECGRVEDIEQCFVSTLQKRVEYDLHHFTHIDAHSLEFFGRCNVCSV